MPRFKALCQIPSLEPMGGRNGTQAITSESDGSGGADPPEEVRTGPTFPVCLFFLKKGILYCSLGFFNIMKKI